MERDVSQKRSLIEDLKAKATAAEMKLRTETQNTVSQDSLYCAASLDFDNTNAIHFFL